MANSLLNLREIRPEPLRSQVQFGLALTVWLCVNEEPPLVPFERQSLLRGNPTSAPPRLAPSAKLPDPLRSIVLWPNYGASA